MSSVGEKFAPSNITFATPKELNDAGTTDASNYTSRLTIFKRYGTSKLANILFNRELQNRLDQKSVRITALALDPGPSATKGGVEVFPGFLHPILKMVMKSPEKAALAPLFAATAREVVVERERYKGQFLNAAGKVVDSSDRSRDEKLAQSLWRTTEEALEAAGIQ